MIIVDSNYLLALAKKSDSLHNLAVDFKIKLSGLGILYLDDILKEVQTIIAVRESHKDSFAWIDSIYKNEIELDRQYNLSSVEYFEVLNYWRTLTNSRLSFTDAEIIYLANKYNFNVLTFDKEIIARLPKKLVFK